jgi:hypothetical protein
MEPGMDALLQQTTDAERREIYRALAQGEIDREECIARLERLGPSDESPAETIASLPAVRVFGYARCFHAHGDSPERTPESEETAIREYVGRKLVFGKAMILGLTGMYVDAEGTLDTPLWLRPQFSELFAQLQPGDHVVASRLVTFGSMLDFHSTHNLLCEREVHLHIADMHGGVGMTFSGEEGAMALRAMSLAREMMRKMDGAQRSGRGRRKRR